MDDNKRFWSRTAGIYERFTTGGRAAGRVYQELEEAVASQLESGWKVLELAAGPGVLSQRIASACGSLEVTDFSPEMVAKARKKPFPPSVSFSVADATALSYKDSTFDAAVMANALHIMPEPTKALAEMKRVVVKGGRLILPTFTREVVRSKLTERLMEAVGFRTFTRWTHISYRAFLEAQGLAIVCNKVITGHNFPISFLVCQAP